MQNIPVIKSDSIVSGLAGVFSGFSKQVTRLAKDFNIDYRDIYFSLGERKVVAGQEDIIIEVVMEILDKQSHG